MTELSDLSDLFHRHRLASDTEKVLQQAIANLLSSRSWTFEREVLLAPGSIIDFVVSGDVGVEVKIKGTLNDVLRQLSRYAESPHLQSLILVTTRMTLSARMPPELGGKPLSAIHLPTVFG